MKPKLKMKNIIVIMLAVVLFSCAEDDVKPKQFPGVMGAIKGVGQSDEALKVAELLKAGPISRVADGPQACQDFGKLVSDYNALINILPYQYALTKQGDPVDIQTFLDEQHHLYVTWVLITICLAG